MLSTTATARIRYVARYPSIAVRKYGLLKRNSSRVGREMVILSTPSPVTLSSVVMKLSAAEVTKDVLGRAIEDIEWE